MNFGRLLSLSLLSIHAIHAIRECPLPAVHQATAYSQRKTLVQDRVYRTVMMSPWRTPFSRRQAVV